MRQLKLSQWIGMCGILLLIVLSRFLLLNDLTFDHDEVWSVWQSTGTISQIIERTPFDWPSGYYLIVGLWQRLVGQLPFGLRIFSVYALLIGCCFTYVAGKRLFRSERAGLLSMLAFASLGYVVYLSVLLRAYAVLMILMPFGLILMMRYFDHPTRLRALQLGGVMALMFYISLSAVFAFAVLGGLSLLYSRKVWRWILPGMIAFIMAIPEFFDKVRMVQQRLASDLGEPLPPLPDAVISMFGEYFGVYALIWIGVLLVAGVGLLYRGKRQLSALHIWLLIWAIGGTCLMYWSHSRTGFFRPRYGWWISWAIALWVGHGLSKLPRIGAYVSGVVLIGLMFSIPADRITAYKEPIGNFEATFQWLRERYTAGDVMVIDPQLQPWRAEVFDYYEGLYFPQNLNVVTRTTDTHQRVWYLRSNSSVDDATNAMVRDGRIDAIFVGKPGFFLQLHVAPPDREGILFDNGLRFHGYEVLYGERTEDATIVRYEGDVLRLRLWWSVDEPLLRDYSVSIQVRDPLQPTNFVQQDETPSPIFLQPNLATFLEPPGTMISWEPGEIYAEERVIELPHFDRLRRTQFMVFMAVYDWQTGERFPASETNENDLLPLFDFTIVAW